MFFKFFAYCSALYVIKCLLEKQWIWIRHKFVSHLRNVHPLTKNGKWAVVTGGNDGIGFGLASEFASRGLNVLIVGRSETNLTDAAKSIKAQSPKTEVRTVVMDLATFRDHSSDFAPMIKAIKELDGGVSVFVNNAGLSYEGASKFEELTDEFIDTIISVNVRSVIRLSKIAYETLLEQGAGSLVCVGSGSATLPTDPLYCVYSATKAAVATFCENLAVEAYPKGISVQCHAPLLIPSKLSKVREGFLSPSVAQYCSSAVDCIESSCEPHWFSIGSSVVVSPYLPHSLVCGLANTLPKMAWDLIRGRQTAALRHKYIAKKQKEATCSK